MNNWKPFKLTTGEEIYNIELNKGEFNRLMKDSATFIDISNQFPTDNSDSKVYFMPNGNILSSDDGYYSIFKNVEDLKKMIDDFSNFNGSEILLNLNPYGKDFGSHSNAIVLDVLKKMDISTKSNIEQLQQIDTFINSHMEYRSTKYLINYIAVIGNMVLKKYGGNWETELASDNETWNPYLKIRGKRYDIITYVYEDAILSEKANLLLSYQSLCDIVDKNNK